MRVELQPRLVEEAVFRAIRATELTSSPAARKIAGDYRRERNAAYESPAENEDRDAHFAAIAAEFFSRLGFEALLQLVIHERALLGRSLSRLTVGLVDSRKREGAEMLVRHGAAGAPDRVGVVGIRAERFEHLPALGTWLRRELLHVSDMVDPAFGYEPELRAESAAGLNLMRDRYRVLWDAWVDARLARAGWIGDRLDAYVPALVRTFGGLGDEVPGMLLDRLRSGVTPTHRDLADWAAGRVSCGSRQHA